ncbi:hypothetical protein D0C36_19760 [Mucilaginibacter conchicola]|uniref:FAD/NAD(P)-binding domain-containing protein n=1 Tax=Mucilaginibacter conchicola TaxID=2303333 RepID=A0A372NQQ9_9SPHI|nr:FAD-dependent oxidoreductase [Mucilaginibacter conchicola]RFZ91178.1 hypothetical protein D0C36_19760 [Mucilaginibacter conchicola]
MRPRLYEVSLEGTRVELDGYLKPLQINQIQGRTESINAENNELSVFTANGIPNISYDYLILATGSSLKAVNLPGISHTFNNDTFNGAKHLEDHMIKLAQNNFENEGDATFVVAGGGFTGLKTVTAIEEKAKLLLEKHSSAAASFRIIMIEKSDKVAYFYSPDSQKYIVETLKAKNIEVITNAAVVSIEPDAVILSNGGRIPISTVIWTAGLTASPLTSCFKGGKDQLNRLSVDQHLKLPGYDNVIIAGDVANVTVSEGRSAVMSCQFSQFQGRWAGHNAVNDLFDMPLKPYQQPGYNTCLDLGSGHAIVTDGWSRDLRHKGEEAKKHKFRISNDLICPPKDIEQAVAASFPKIPQF